MLDKIDRKLLALLQQDCTLSLQALAEAVNLTTTPCWKRLKRLEDDGILIGKVALLDPEKIGLGLTAFVLIKTQHHSSEWYCRFVTVVTEMPEVLGFWRMAGEYDYLMRVQVADMKRYDEFYKRLVNSVPGLSDVTSSFAMEQIKYTTSYLSNKYPESSQDTTRAIICSIKLVFPSGMASLSRGCRLACHYRDAATGSAKSGWYCC